MWRAHLSTVVRTPMTSDRRAHIVRGVALISQMIRASAITGRPERVHAWFADRQSGRWVDRMVRDAMPAGSAAAPRDRAETLGELTELHRSGALTDDELAALRARLHV
jgi:hypothetical protein